MIVRLALGCQPPWPAGPSPTAYIRLQPADLSLPTALLSGAFVHACLFVLLPFWIGFNVSCGGSMVYLLVRGFRLQWLLWTTCTSRSTRWNCWALELAPVESGEVYAEIFCSVDWIRTVILWTCKCWIRTLNPAVFYIILSLCSTCSSFQPYSCIGIIFLDDKVALHSSISQTYKSIHADFPASTIWTADAILKSF